MEGKYENYTKIMSEPSKAPPSTLPSALPNAPPSTLPSALPNAPPSTPPEQEYTPEQLKFKDALNAVGPDAMRAKIIREADNAKYNPPPAAGVTAEHAFAYTMAVGTNVSTLAISAAKLIKEQLPREGIKLLNELTEQVKEDNEAEKVFDPNNSRPMIGGTTGTMTVKIKKYNKMLFCTAYIPGAFTLIIFAYLVLVMLWPAIQRILNIINKYIGTNFNLPSIMLKKKPAQTIYSIFFVITSFFLMLYLFIDYFRNVGPELDIVQILKQLIGASYILWPMVILIIGSGIAKAFYKISCNGNKPNVLSWAKIVDSFTLNIVVMTVLITVILLLKPIKILYNKITPFIQGRFNFVFVIVAVTLKLMVIYILLRMITVMIENVISNKIVFFLSKLNNDIEPPPVDCNAEKEEKEAKQSEIAKILEEIYMYISGIIMYIIMFFFIVIQCPHPYIFSVYKINLDNGALILKLTDISTRYIVENSYGNKNCSQKNKGSGLGFSSLLSSLGKTGPQSDSTADAYSSKFKEMAAAEKAGDASQAAAQTANTAAAAAYRRNIKESASSYTITAPSAKAYTSTAPLAPPSAPPSAEYVVSKGDDRHSAVQEPIVDHNLRNYDLIRSQYPTRAKKLQPMEGIASQALSQNVGLDPKKLLPLTPIVRGEAKPTNHGRGTTPADKTFHPNDTPTLE